ncbi:MAG: cobyric acid synthase [Desulfurella sp.]|uniref:cobyric acid synthase n=1 Tax=Desulfurella sp. TaxID=1962857 RepID=UPI003D137766
MNDILVLGSSSSAGKSTITMFLLNILKQNNIKALPFKAQNFSNNSTVADDNTEIAFAQYFQAKSVNLKTNYLMNPLLVKSANNQKLHIILNGKFFDEINTSEFYANIDTFKSSIEKSYKNLKKQGLIVAEGAGSPTELNFLEKDLANVFIAKTFKPKIIFVADIERGGVFASIYGTKELFKKIGLEISGVIINKFRGDIRLFDQGVKIIENEFGLPILGILPYKTLNIGYEDSFNIDNYNQNKKPLIRAGVYRFRHISNYFDIEPLVLDKNVEVTFFNDLNLAEMFDVVILPGTRQTVFDLMLLKKQDYKVLKKCKIIALCGGYQMLFSDIFDNVESNVGHTKGLGLIDGPVYFLREKTLKRSVYNIAGFDVEGFEMHFGQTEKLFYEDENIFGTLVHEALFSDKLRTYLLKKVNPNYPGFCYKKAYKKHLAQFIQTSKMNFYVDKFIKLL